MGGTKESATVTYGRPHELGKPVTYGIVKRKGLAQATLPSKRSNRHGREMGRKGEFGMYMAYCAVYTLLYYGSLG